MTKTKLYVKSMDGTRWYVGSEPCKPQRSTGFQLGSYFYGATDGDMNNNLMRARSYARGLVAAFDGYEIADYGMGETYKRRTEK